MLLDNSHRLPPSSDVFFVVYLVFRVDQEDWPASKNYFPPFRSENK